MEVKGIERWGADWQNVVVGELLTRREAPARRPAVADAGSRSATASRSTSSAARRTSRAGQRVPVALPGAVLPGDRRIERTEKMGVVSNGMLCSGDELRLTADADGILILPADTPLGRAARRPVRRHRARRRRQAEPRRRAVDRRAGPRGRGRDRRAASACPTTEPTESGRADRRAPRASRSEDPDLCPRFVGRWVERRDRRPVAGRGPDAAAGRRPAADQQRRRRLATT